MAAYAELTAAVFTIPGGREKVFVLEPAASGSATPTVD